MKRFRLVSIFALLLYIIPFITSLYTSSNMLSNILIVDKLLMSFEFLFLTIHQLSPIELNNVYS